MIKMEEPIKLAIVSLSSIPMYLYIGYLIGKSGAKAWIGVTLFITVAVATLYAFF